MNKIERLHRKLIFHQENNCVDLVSDIDELIQIANDAEDEYDELKEEHEELEEDLDENQADSEINTGNDGGIIYKSTNLLDTQIIEAVKEIMESSVNQVSFLQHLQKIAKNGLQ